MGRTDCHFLGVLYGTTFRSDRWRSLIGIGLLCLSLSVIFHLFCLYVLGVAFVSHSVAALAVFYGLYVPCAILALWSLYRTWSTDPGAVPMGARPLPSHLAASAEAERERMEAERDLEAAGVGSRSGHESGSGEGRDDADTAAETRIGPPEDLATPVTFGRNPSDMRRARLRRMLALLPVRFHSLLPRRRSLDGKSASYEGRYPSSAPSGMGRFYNRFRRSGSRDSCAAIDTDPTRSRCIRRCTKCDLNYKPPRAHHDRVTGRCIVKLDHYCPWVCNAVGALNHKFFVLFVLYSFLDAVTSAVLIRMRYVRCGYDLASGFYSGIYRNDVPGCIDPSSPEVAALCIMTAWFLVFTSCMLCGQVAAIRRGTAKIAQMKIRAGEAREDELGSVRTDFNEMFGGTSGRFQWHWLLPTDVTFPEGAFEEVMGYSYDPSSDGRVPWKWEDSVEITPLPRRDDLSRRLDGGDDEEIQTPYSELT